MPQISLALNMSATAGYMNGKRAISNVLFSRSALQLHAIRDSACPEGKND